MAFRADEIAPIEAAMADFFLKRRPRPEIRHQVDLAYRINRDQSVEIYTVRPAWDKPAETIHMSIAKAKYRRNAERWDIFWMRASGKWNLYAPHPEAMFFDEFLAVVDEDANCCFWG